MALAKIKPPCAWGRLCILSEGLCWVAATACILIRAQHALLAHQGPPPALQTVDSRPRRGPPKASSRVGTTRAGARGCACVQATRTPSLCTSKRVHSRSGDPSFQFPAQQRTAQGIQSGRYSTRGRARLRVVYKQRARPCCAQANARIRAQATPASRSPPAPRTCPWTMRGRAWWAAPRARRRRSRRPQLESRFSP